jgi:YHS domain-containing protein
MMLKGGGCCGGHSHEDHNHGGDSNSGYDNKNNMNSSAKNNIDMVKDPVCGMYVYPATAIQETIDGKTYHFCSESCRNKFINTKAAS